MAVILSLCTCVLILSYHGNDTMIIDPPPEDNLITLSDVL